MKDARCNPSSFSSAARVWAASAALATCLVAASGVALAACPDPKSEAEHVAAGAVVFTGRVRAVGPNDLTARLKYADLDVTEGGARTVRVYAPDVGLYTAIFRVGEVQRIIAYRGEHGLQTDLCLYVRP